MGLISDFKIIVNGNDVSEKIKNFNSEISVTDGTGFESDAFEISIINNRLNPISIPDANAIINVYFILNGKEAHMGQYTLDEAVVEGWPGRVILRGRAAPFVGAGGINAIQTQKSRSWKAGLTIGAIVGKIAKECGLSESVSSELSSIVLPHLDQSDESDLNFLLRVGRKYDAIVKPSGGKLVMVKAGGVLSSSGKSLPSISIKASECSAFRWDRSARETTGTVVAYWHLTKTAKRNEVHVGSGDPVTRLKYYYPDSGMALAAAKADLARRQRGGIQASLTCIGNINLCAEAPLTISGFNPGVDGDYKITNVVHRMGTQTGYSCDVEFSLKDTDGDPDANFA